MMEKRERVSKIICFFFLILFLFSLLQVISPLLLPTGMYTNLSGMVGINDNDHLIESMPIPLNFIYSCGDRLCHQKAERSFLLNENQMPFCSRCSAIWIGLAIGLGVLVFYTIGLDEKFLYLLLLSFIPIGVDGVGQLIGFWVSTNVIRVFTGLLVGITSGMGIGIIIDELKNNVFQGDGKTVKK
jgi:uncharacterized membrane protein